jgi:hypothetical protein
MANVFPEKILTSSKNIAGAGTDLRCLPYGKFQAISFSLPGWLMVLFASRPQEE